MELPSTSLKLVLGVQKVITFLAMQKPMKILKGECPPASSFVAFGRMAFTYHVLVIQVEGSHVDILNTSK